MELTIVGSSPSVESPGGASSSYLISDGDTHLLVDCGHAAVSVLGEVTSLDRLTAVVISHMHPDHIFDLVPLAYGLRFGNLAPVPLYLPPRGQDVLTALGNAVDLAPELFSRSFVLHTYDPEQALQIGPLQIRFARTRHFLECYAMRITDSGGRTLGYSSDTGWSDTVLELLRGSQVALVEATVARYGNDHERQGHLDAESAGKLAREAEVERLIVTHTWAPHADEILRLATDAFGGPVSLARSRDKVAF